jgi:hypothetical protein
MRRQQKPAQTMVIHRLGPRYSFFSVHLSLYITYIFFMHSRIYLRRNRKKWGVRSDHLRSDFLTEVGQGLQGVGIGEMG